MSTPAEPPVVHGDATTPPTEGADTRGTGTDVLRAELVALIVGEYPHSWSVPTRRHAEQIADAVLAAGYVRLDENAEYRVAMVLFAASLPSGAGEAEVGRAWFKRAGQRDRDGWVRRARVVLAAVRGGS